MWGVGHKVFACSESPAGRSLVLSGLMCDYVGGRVIRSEWGTALVGEGRNSEEEKIGSDSLAVVSGLI